MCVTQSLKKAKAAAAQYLITKNSTSDVWETEAEAAEELLEIGVEKFHNKYTNALLQYPVIHESKLS